MTAIDTSLVFGIGRVVERETAQQLTSDLKCLWVAQTGRALGPVREDLELLKIWFNPVASGERLRRELARAPEPTGSRLVQPPLIYEVSKQGVIVTPEGRAALELLESAMSGSHSPSHVVIDPELAFTLLRELLNLYREWSRQRLNGVVGLLAEETATLRPGAAGLLLVLLINRNTAPERALPRPRDDAARRTIERAIGTPAMAWTEEFTGRRPSGAGLDLYRGWAIGELARRLGPALHLGFDEPGIFIATPAVDTAVGRLVADLKRRPAKARARVPSSWAALLTSYRQQRPILASLGVAFELPSVTRELGERLFSAAGATGDERAGAGPSLDG